MVGPTLWATLGGPAFAAVTCGPLADRQLALREISLGAEAAGGRLAALAMVDIDRDGRKDLVGAVVPPFGKKTPMGLWSTVIDRGESRLRSYAGLSFAGLRVLPADLDGDGNTEVVLADPLNDEVVRIVWLPDGLAVSPKYPLDIGPSPIVADLGADGHDELLSVSPIGDATVWSIDAGGPLQLDNGTVVDGVEQAVGDLDGDGVPEWIMAQGTRSRLTVAWGGDLDAQQTYRVPIRDARAIAPVDLDVDGQSELLVLDRARAAVRAFSGDRLKPGRWLLRLATRAARNKPQSLHVADLDDDGCMDVLLHSFVTHELAIAWGGNRGRNHVQRLVTGQGPIAVGQLDDVAGADVAVVADDRVLVVVAPPNAP